MSCMLTRTVAEIRRHPGRSRGCVGGSGRSSSVSQKLDQRQDMQLIVESYSYDSLKKMPKNALL